MHRARGRGQGVGAEVDAGFTLRWRIEADHEIDVARALAHEGIADVDCRHRLVGLAMGADGCLADAVGDPDQVASRAGQRAQHQAEHLVRRGHAIARQHDRHVLDGFSGAEGQAAVGGKVIAAGMGIAVERGIVDAETASDCLVEHHGKGGGTGAGVDHDVTYRQAGWVGAVGDAIVVDDRGDAVGIADHGVVHVRQYQGEGFERFDGQVVGQRDAHRLGGGARDEHQHAAGIDVVLHAARGGGQGIGAESHAHFAF